MRGNVLSSIIDVILDKKPGIHLEKDEIGYIETETGLYRITDDNGLDDGGLVCIRKFTTITESGKPELVWGLTVEYDLERIKKLIMILNRKSNERKSSKAVEA